MKRFIFLAFISLLFFSCKKTQPQDNLAKFVDTLKVKNIDDTSLLKGVILQKKPVKIDSPSVVFFMPDYKERQQIIHFYGEYDRYDFEHIFNNFRRLALDTRQSLAPYHIKSFLSYSPEFEIKTDSGYVHFNRKDQNEIIGFILADGHKQPMIKFGLYKYIEIERLIRNYFEILDFKMHTQPETYKVRSVPHYKPSNQ